MSAKILEQASVIEGYNELLEAENRAKLQQIQQLKRQMELATLSSRLQALNIEKNCKQCARKDQQIQTLIKALKLLRTSVTTVSRTTIKQAEDNYHENENQIVEITGKEQNVLQKRVSFMSQQADINKRAKQIQENRSYGKILSSDKSKGYLNSVRNRSKQSGSITNLHKFVNRDVIALKTKICELEKKIFILQQTNNLLREQLKTKLGQNQLNQQQFNGYGLKKKQKVMSPIASLASDEIQKRIPTFSNVRANVTKNVLTIPEPRAPNVSVVSQRQRSQKTERDQQRLNNTVKYVSPLPNLTLTSNNPIRHSSKQNEMIEQRRKSLNYKIKILQGQNKRLRTEMNSFNN